MARARADAERTAAAARQAADASATALKEARRRIDALEQERTTLVLARDIAETQLDGEIQHRNKIAAELQAAREKAGADAESMELHAAAALDRVRSVLQRLTKATTAQEVVDRALELLGEQFSRAALFAVGRQGLTVWGSQGFDPPLPNRKAVPPGTGNSPLMRAALDALTRAELGAKPVTAIAKDDETLLGLTGEAMSYAVALPIVGKEQSALILYAEEAARTSSAEAAVAGRTAEIIGDHLAHRLRTRRPAAAAAQPTHAPARQAPRVKFEESAKIAIDGEPSRLVDLSVLGAQVVTPHAIRPDGFVRLLMPSDRGSLSCEARVVWVSSNRGRKATAPCTAPASSSRKSTRPPSTPFAASTASPRRSSSTRALRGPKDNGQSKGHSLRSDSRSGRYQRGRRRRLRLASGGPHHGLRGRPSRFNQKLLHLVLKLHQRTEVMEGVGAQIAVSAHDQRDPSSMFAVVEHQALATPLIARRQHTRCIGRRQSRLKVDHARPPEIVRSRAWSGRRAHGRAKV